MNSAYQPNKIIENIHHAGASVSSHAGASVSPVCPNEAGASVPLVPLISNPKTKTGFQLSHTAIILTILLFFTIALSSNAQVSIDAAPDSSATLNIGIKPNMRRGLLIPRMSYSAGLYQWISSGEPKTHSLMLFDTDFDRLVFWNSNFSHWQMINPWVGRYNPNVSQSDYAYTNLRVGIGTDTPSDTLQLHVQGDAKVEGVLSADRLVGEVPPGGIIMYSGDLAANFNADGSGKANTKYEGWQLCNGQNGAPDLRGRFVVGYDGSASTTPTNATNKEINYGKTGNTGGKNNVLLTADESGVQSHNHSIDHGHSITDPGHTHQINNMGNEKVGDANKQASYNRNDGDYKETDSNTTGITVNNYIGNSGNNSANAKESHENRPPYMVLAYIMKL